MKATITTYAELSKWVKGFSADDGLGLFVLVGSPGLSKSRTVKALATDDTWVCKAGQLTAFQLYKALYRHKDLPIVLDDIETALKDSTAVRLLMAVTETDEAARKVGWFGSVSLLTYTAPSGKVVKIPQEFCTTSRICVICNNWTLLSQKLTALEDRGYVIHFEPSTAEVHDYVEKWFTDTEIYEFVGNHLALIPVPSIRHYVKAQKLKALRMDWRAALLLTWEGEAGDRDATYARLVCRNPVFATRDQQCKEWMRLSGKARATFYRVVKRLGL
jgi:hypothetical protein